LVPSHDKGCVITPDKLGLILISDYVGHDIESNFSPVGYFRVTTKGMGDYYACPLKYTHLNLIISQIKPLVKNINALTYLTSVDTGYFVFDSFPSNFSSTFW
jgi:hypothetical protein